MVRKSNASGQQLEEAKTINKSLSALGQVREFLMRFWTTLLLISQKNDRNFSISKLPLLYLRPWPCLHFPPVTFECGAFGFVANSDEWLVFNV